MPFVHLRTHTEFSVVDGTLRIDDAAAAAAADGQVALGITDLANLFGAVKFYKACRSKGVKPLLGADLWLEPAQGSAGPLPSSLDPLGGPDAQRQVWGRLEGGSDKAASRLLVLVQSPEGYLNLCELLARAWTRNVQRAQAWVTWEWLAELGGGLIALSGAEHGAVGSALLTGDTARARQLAERLAGLFPGRFYLELQRAGLPQQEALVRATVPLAAELKLPVVATHPVQFLA
ncbi:MAG TPA: PHP domain-containing protein, partial [Ideonella sp.]|nr:PHP domain-containing protein [Ideonella sp.]